MEGQRTQEHHRRPRRDRREHEGREGRFSGGRRGRESQAEREAREEAMAAELQMRIEDFLDSDEDELELEPMNSFKRRMAHQVAKQCRVDTESRGEEPHRYVALLRTDDSAVPQAAVPRASHSEASSAGSSAPDSGGDERRPAPRREASGRDRESAGRDSSRSGPRRSVDYGTQTFAVAPGAEGLRIALMHDGAIEIWREKEQGRVIDERFVTASALRIRQGRIIQPGEAGW